jgi:hypothetical protein
MQQPNEREVTIYGDIVEVRMETRPGNYKKLLAEGWVLLGVYPLTTAGDEYGTFRRQKQQPQDTPRIVRRLVGYVVGKRRE